MQFIQPNRHKDGEPFEVDENDTRILFLNNDMTLAFTVLKPEDSGYYECIGENRIAKEAKAIDILVISKFLSKLPSLTVIGWDRTLFLSILSVYDFVWGIMVSGI